FLLSPFISAGRGPGRKRSPRHARSEVVAMRRFFASTVVGLALSLSWLAPQRGQAQSYGAPSGLGSGSPPPMPGYPYAATPYGVQPGMYSPCGGYQGMGYGGYAGMGYGGYSPSGGYAPVAPTSQAEVAIYDNYFEPRTVYLTPGGTVHWTNRGRREHTVTDY